jgi:hypothetical protein
VNNAETSIPKINAELVNDTYQGDVRLTVEQATILLGESNRIKRQAYVDLFYPQTLWRTANGTPYFSYTIDSSLSKSVFRHFVRKSYLLIANETANLIRQAVEFWQDNTCINAIENGTEIPNMVEFYQGIGCTSFVGRIAAYSWPIKQPISIGLGCEHVNCIRDRSCLTKVREIFFDSTRNRSVSQTFLARKLTHRHVQRTNAFDVFSSASSLTNLDMHLAFFTSKAGTMFSYQSQL